MRFGSTKPIKHRESYYIWGLRKEKEGMHIYGETV